MSKAIYIATTEPNSGKSIVSLGLMQILLGKTAKVGYFRPIVDDLKEGQIDNHIQTVLSHFEVDMKPEDAYAFTRSKVLQLKNQDKDDEIISHIIHKFKAIEDRFDFVLVEGTDFSGEGAIIEWDINVLVAKNLGIPAVIITSGAGKTLEELVGNLYMGFDSFREKGVEVLLTVANKVQPENLEVVVAALKKKLPEKVLIGAIPANPTLGNPTVKEIASQLDAKVLFGEGYLNNQANGFSVGAMQLRNYLTHLKKDSLVITPGDRADIILGALQANISTNYPNLSGIVLTGGLIPEDSIIKLIEGLSDIIPIISVNQGTFAVTNKIGAIKPKIYADNTEKITTSIQEFEKHIPVNDLAERLITFKAEGITPRMFQYNLLKRAKSAKKHIVLPEGTDERILIAAKKLLEVEAVTLTLLGDKDQITAKMEELALVFNPGEIDIIDPKNSANFLDYATTLYELRKHKNVNLAMAKDLMEDVSYFGTMMVHKGHADGMVSGAVHTTQHTILPALQFIKTKPGVSLVSSVFFMCLPNRVTIFGDCAINPNPTAEQLSEIAISSAATSAAFGIEPKVAMLSYSSGASGIGEDVDRVRTATKLIKEKRPDLKVEGPIQYDAAVDSKVGKSKLPDSEVAGQASVFIFPDLNTGNNTYKAVQRETGALAIGPMLQGLNKPVNDLSRGCTVEDIFNTVIITAIQAEGL
ncbi:MULTISPECIES: phosphate acetyltransferase [Cellulophaga]|uniref:Phosphate acetyltransferase n=1 Tax=Cellulophaga baltica 18 TaxID=1348584 RepID=A0AAU8RQ17_9FLAO|nr:MULTISPECIES: phosphate acetyltransferase [Cellulophaga]AIZ42226.1 phosphate acetyltransferase [Cellulophaga baltica 18]KGK29064.1 phosphate acetyltransferase [Cellulophaga sp. E6(2014)]MCR1025036.1 phosphate acetyltransferase [Cellulophaga baltica]WFO17369.1 phosphate acetyltransferase [Cellulophaga baltica 4]